MIRASFSRCGPVALELISFKMNGEHCKKVHEGHLSTGTSPKISCEQSCWPSCSPDLEQTGNLLGSLVHNERMEWHTRFSYVKEARLDEWVNARQAAAGNLSSSSSMSSRIFDATKAM